MTQAASHAPRVAQGHVQCTIDLGTGARVHVERACRRMGSEGVRRQAPPEALAEGGHRDGKTNTYRPGCRAYLNHATWTGDLALVADSAPDFEVMAQHLQGRLNKDGMPRALENMCMDSDRHQRGPGRRQTGGHSTHLPNLWHHPWCRQGRTKDRGSMARGLESNRSGYPAGPSFSNCGSTQWKQQVAPVLAIGAWSWPWSRNMSSASPPKPIACSACFLHLRRNAEESWVDQHASSMRRSRAKAQPVAGVPWAQRLLAQCDKVWLGLGTASPRGLLGHGHCCVAKQSQKPPRQISEKGSNTLKRRLEGSSGGQCNEHGRATNSKV